MGPAELSRRQAAGQRIIAGFSGTALNAELRHLVGTIGVGGIILFSRNIENARQLRQLCTDVQDHARSSGQPPLIIAVDQEGGSVARLKAPEFKEIPAASAVPDETGAAALARLTARQLRAAGINMNMAPVMDVAAAGSRSVMAGRSYGGDPNRVARLGAAVIGALQANGVMSVAKHFPGLGRTVADSHLELPDLDTPAEELEKTDLVPFYAAIGCRAAGIMLSHARYAALDPKRPASLSPLVAQGLLRQKMGYTGLSITDDLEMGAVQNYCDTAAAAWQMARAGVDAALICSSIDHVESAYDALLSRLPRRPPRPSPDEPLGRILAVKKSYLSY